jgi:chromosomal replication initiator protein
MAEPRSRTGLSFERFVVTRGAIEAVESCRSLASGHADAPRLLLLHGSSGSGKTHLLHSITSAIRDRDPSIPIVETSATDVVQEMTAALRRGKAADLEQLWPQGAVVTIDDLHVLTGQAMTQREVGRLFVAALERGSRLVCATGGLAEIPAVITAVRAHSGVRFVALRRPSRADMRRILAGMARAEGLRLPAKALRSLAAGCRGDVRRAVSAITHQRFETAAARLSGRPVPAA